MSRRKLMLPVSLNKSLSCFFFLLFLALFSQDDPVGCEGQAACSKVHFSLSSGGCYSHIDQTGRIQGVSAKRKCLWHGLSVSSGAD